jgi:hypothetical protein
VFASLSTDFSFVVPALVVAVVTSLFAVDITEAITFAEGFGGFGGGLGLDRGRLIVVVAVVDIVEEEATDVNNQALTTGAFSTTMALCVCRVDSASY